MKKSYIIYNLEYDVLGVVDGTAFRDEAEFVNSLFSLLPEDADFNVEAVSYYRTLLEAVKELKGSLR